MAIRAHFTEGIDKITQWIDQRNQSISFMIGLATVFWITANAYYNDLAAVGDPVIKQTGKELGIMGLGCAVAAFSYYILREIYIYGRRESPFFKHHQSFFSFSILVLRRLHIWFGVLAVTFIIDHGYLLGTIHRKGIDDRYIQTGLTAAVVLGLVAFSGAFIRRYPSVTKIRLAHRLFAFLVFFGYLLHITVSR